jgi:hypothetical protein
MTAERGEAAGSRLQAAGEAGRARTTRRMGASVQVAQLDPERRVVPRACSLQAAAWRRRALCVAAILGSAAATLAGTSDPPVGGQAKEFKITAALNMRPTTHPFRACRGRVVLLTAFETWYPTCSDAVADINAIHDKYGPLGLTVLAYGAQERKVVEPWIAEKGVKFPWVLIDTPTQEQFKRDWPAPGMPWSYLIDVDGRIVWQENPRNIPNPNVLKPGTLEPLLAQTSAPPLLPRSLADQQKLLDDGLWAAAKRSLEEAGAGGKLDKADTGWAKGTASWIGRRHSALFDDVDALSKKGWWWDAWKAVDEYPTKWEGGAEAEKAKAKAEEIRKVAEAAKDLAWGDDIWGNPNAKEDVSLRALVAKKNWNPARQKLARLAKETKGTRWADRVAELAESIPPK